MGRSGVNRCQGSKIYFTPASAGKYGRSLKLLLDEHFWPKLAELVKQTLPNQEIESLHQYAQGRWLNSPDDELLAEAHRGGWVWVTSDVNTIPRLLQEKAVAAEDHSGVIFISSKSYAQNDHAGLTAALIELIDRDGKGEWINRILFLEKGGPTRSKD